MQGISRTCIFRAAGLKSTDPSHTSGTNHAADRSDLRLRELHHQILENFSQGSGPRNQLYVPSEIGTRNLGWETRETQEEKCLSTNSTMSSSERVTHFLLSKAPSIVDPARSAPGPLQSITSSPAPQTQTLHLPSRGPDASIPQSLAVSNSDSRLAGGMSSGNWLMS